MASLNMQQFWITAELDDATTLSRCFTASDRDTAVARMMAYLELEFGAATTAAG
ncbi:MAG: hypothetical protein VKO64_00620 [Candidatus Sericytochromatia bacterium]|nr:hypothetical protein [Candidatus Sericytochromatia bacterium]